jgi:hypothetical protein
LSIRDDGLAHPALVERAREANESDDPLDEDQRGEERHRACVTESVRGPQPLERVAQQPA